jgi:hypothetical protein
MKGRGRLGYTSQTQVTGITKEGPHELGAATTGSMSVPLPASLIEKNGPVKKFVIT